MLFKMMSAGLKLYTNFFFPFSLTKNVSSITQHTSKDTWVYFRSLIAVQYWSYKVYLSCLNYLESFKKYFHI